MKLDKICRTCLLDKANLRNVFDACVANMLMSCASVQVNIHIKCLVNFSRIKFLGNGRRWSATSNLYTMPTKC